MNKQIFTLVLRMFVLVFLLAGCGNEPASVEVTRIVEVTRVVKEVETAEPAKSISTSDTLDAVLERGYLNCGVGGTLLGFSYIDENGTMRGFDADYCRAVATAVFGDANAVEFRSANATERFPILQSGEIDILIRNTTWTFSRDTALGFNFAPTTFYDGQGIIVRRESDITSLAGLNGGTVCVTSGTSTEKNLADVFRSRDIDYEAVIFAEGLEMIQGYDDGRCDAMSADKSALIANSHLFSEPEAHMILEETLSKEPLGPLVRHGDDNWYDIVKWTVNCTIQAEELGVDSRNVDAALGSDDPRIRILLGVEGDLAQAISLDNDFCYQVIKQVGNYREIYNRALGPGTPYDLPRGLNSLWTDGGLLYAPPFR